MTEEGAPQNGREYEAAGRGEGHLVARGGWRRHWHPRRISESGPSMGQRKERTWGGEGTLTHRPWPGSPAGVVTAPRPSFQATLEELGGTSGSVPGGPPTPVP